MSKTDAFGGRSGRGDDGRADRRAFCECGRAGGPARPDRRCGARGPQTRARAQTRSLLHARDRFPHHDRRPRHRLRGAGVRGLDHGSGRRTARRQARAARAGRRRPAPGHDRVVEHVRDSDRDARRGAQRRFPPALARHAFLQPAALPSSRRSHSDGRNRSGCRRTGVAVRGSSPRQGRRHREGHAELHRQSSRALRRDADAEGARERPLHDRRDRRDDRARARPTEERDVPDDGHRRHRHPRARRPESRLRASGVRDEDDRERDGRREGRSRLLQAGEDKGRQRHPHARSCHARVPAETARADRVDRGRRNRSRTPANASRRCSTRRTRPATSSARRSDPRWSTPPGSRPTSPTRPTMSIA